MYSQLVKNNHTMRGQVFSYDALGGIVIFLIAIGILVTYWSSVNASFSEEDAILVLEANTALDRIMSPGIMLNQDMYTINITKLRNCEVDRDYVGLVHNYTFEVIDDKNNVIKRCGDITPQNTAKIAFAERIAYYKENVEEKPVLVRLKVFVQ